MNRSTSKRLVKDRPAPSVDLSTGPKPAVTLVDALALTVGIVIGAGIFRTPSLVASNAANARTVYAVWAAGGAISLIGALVYAELTTTYPHTGGEYHYLARAFGHRLGFLFAWARLTVIQTGSIATFAFVCGDYLRQILSFGEFSSPIYAALIVSIFTLLNVLGVREGTRAQNLLTSVEVFGILLVIAAGLSVTAPAVPAGGSGPGTSASSLGLMMVFVLFTYGGWNEAAYVSGELHNARQNMIRVLITGILIITALYILINVGYLHSLGLSNAGKSELIAADVMRRAFGEAGAKAISVFVAISALTSANATIFTGARTSYAFGCDFRAFRFLGRWNERTSTPLNALLVQGGVALALVFLGTFTRKGFETIVEYTAPVFWFFFLLTGASLFVLRRKDRAVPRPFRVPFYPVTPIVFCITCAYLLYSSLAYTGIGALVGVVVLATGGLLLIFLSSSTLNVKEN
jgi:APA family basic amino acid/polyamine antiporter